MLLSTVPHGSPLSSFSCCSSSLSFRNRTLLSAIVFSTGVWVSGILMCRHALKLLLSYHGWMFEPHGKTSCSTKIWAVSHLRALFLGHDARELGGGAVMVLAGCQLLHVHTR